MVKVVQKVDLNIHQGRQQHFESSLFWSPDDVDDIESRLIVRNINGLPFGACGDVDGSGCK